MRLSTSTLSKLNTRSFFVAFVIAIGVIAFMLTGVGLRMNHMDSSTAASVGSQTVSMRSLADAVQELNTQAGADLNESKRNQNTETALSQLIQEKVLIEEATRMGFKPNDVEVADWIRRIEAFQDPKTKQFDPALYKRFLKSGRMSELDLFSRGRDALTQQKLYALYQVPAYLPTELAKQLTMRNDTEFNVEALELKVSEDAVKKATADEAKKFADNKSNETKLKQAYETAKSEFSQKAAVHVRSVLIAYKDAQRAEGDALKRSEDEARKMAESALAKLKSGTNFEAVSNTTNDDSRARAAKGDLGWVEAGSLDPDSTKAAMSLSKDKKLSDVIKTPFGFRIFQWIDSRPAVQKTFDEVKFELAEREVSPPIRTRLSTELENEVRTALDSKDPAKLTEVLAKHGLQWKKIEKPISVNARYVEGVGMTDGIMGSLFALHTAGDVTKQPVDVGGKKMIFRLLSRKEGATPDEKKIDAARRMQEMRQLQAFASQTQQKLIDIYNRNKEIHRNPDLLTVR